MSSAESPRVCTTSDESPLLTNKVVKGPRKSDEIWLFWGVMKSFVVIGAEYVVRPIYSLKKWSLISRFVLIDFFASLMKQTK